MKRATGSTTALALLLLAGLTLPARAQEAKPEAKPATAPAATGIRAEVLRQIEDAEKKLIALAEATPAEKYIWKPAEGVRSTGQVFLHVAAANYFLPTFVGAKAPEGLDLRNLEKDAADKAKTVDTLKKSFDHAKQAVQAVADADLDKAVKIFGRDSSYREACLFLATHAHEHLGQSIAYARMNGITPPWSGGGQ